MEEVRAPDLQPEDFQAAEALYYPGPEFPSVAWLQAGLLYWESILRIVPDGWTPEDPPEVTALVEAGAVQNRSPEPFCRATAHTFATRLADLMQSRNGKQLDEEWCDASERGPSHTETFHRTELDEGLIKELQSKKLFSSKGEWVQMSRPLARLYRVTMVNEARRALYTSAVTENYSCTVASTYFSARTVTSDRTGVPPGGWRAAAIQVPFVSIETAGALSVEKLLTLRAEHAGSRQSLRDRIQSRTEALATMPSADAIRAHLEQMAKELKGDLENPREALRAAEVRDHWTFISIGCPLPIGTAEALVTGPNPPVEVGRFGRLNLAVTNWYLDLEAQLRKRRHCLLAVGRDLNRQEVIDDLDHRLGLLVQGSAPRAHLQQGPPADPWRMRDHDRPSSG
jgi:hypothetical protein